MPPDHAPAGGLSAGEHGIRAAYHVHTQYSYDSATPLEEVLERAARAGIRCLCVTDHDTIDGAVALRAIAPRDVEVVVGCEFTADDGSHVIGMGLSDFIDEKRLFPLLDRIKEQGGLVVLPHPFRRSSGLFRAEMRRQADFVERVLAAADIVECFNGGDSYEHNVRNGELARRRGLGSVAGSDSHTPDEIGSVFVEYAHADFVHGESARGIYFVPQGASREHPVKKRLLELYHARKGGLPGAVNAAYSISRKALGRRVTRRPAGSPQLQYRLSGSPSVSASHDA